MSTSNNINSESDSGNSAADAVRQAFAALPLDQKLSTLLCVELDMLGDAVKTVVSAASRVADEIANAFAGPDTETPEGSGASSSA